MTTACLRDQKQSMHAEEAIGLQISKLRHLWAAWGLYHTQAIAS